MHDVDVPKPGRALQPWPAQHVPRVVEEGPREPQHDGVELGQPELAQARAHLLSAVAGDEGHQGDGAGIVGRQGGQ